MSMRPIPERSAGILPFRIGRDGRPVYLLIHSARVRNPKARWGFPKGGIEAGESERAAAIREFEVETGIRSWTIREGFERRLPYTYWIHGHRRLKTVTYFLGEVFDAATWGHLTNTRWTRTVAGPFGVPRR